MAEVSNLIWLFTNKIKEYSRKLYIHTLEGKILFSPELEKIIQEIFKMENKITNEIRNYLESMNDKKCPGS